MGQRIEREGDCPYDSCEIIMSPPPAARARPLPALGFLLALLALATLALYALRTAPPIVTGLPEDPDVARTRVLVLDRLRPDSGELRFRSALLGQRGEADVALATAAEAPLLAARRRLPRDPRLLAALACLSLCAQRHARAERFYRQALDLSPTYGEARLGLGVTLALRASVDGDDARQRGLRLRAISQLASVPVGDPCYEAALYDRALLLVRVGRSEEARHWASAYLARDPGSAWAAELTRALPGVGE
jgi:tetratricopeptide (TPR) repeat protein